MNYALFFEFLSVARTCFWPPYNCSEIKLTLGLSRLLSQFHFLLLQTSSLLSESTSTCWWFPFFLRTFLSIIFCFVFILSTAVSQSFHFKMHSNIDFVIIKLLKSPFWCPYGLADWLTTLMCTLLFCKVQTRIFHMLREGMLTKRRRKIFKFWVFLFNVLQGSHDVTAWRCLRFMYIFLCFFIEIIYIILDFFTFFFKLKFGYSFDSLDFPSMYNERTGNLIFTVYAVSMSLFW